VTAILLFISALACAALWWLWRQGLATKPWLATGIGAEEAPMPMSAAKLGLGVFMAVAASLLVLLISAYSMRMELADWNAPPQPALLWVNTAVLILASLALHRAVLAGRRADRPAIAAGLRLGGAATLAFLLGQCLAWRELAAAGYRLSSNPADAFFYLITAVHGLHVIGGLLAIARTAAKLRRGVPMDRVGLSLELCATYSHFLLAAWLVLFSVLAFSPQLGWFITICTAPFR
jgi:cytochrome c oxidase subunit 3